MTDLREFYRQRDVRLEHLHGEERRRWQAYAQSGNVADLEGQDVKNALYLTSVKKGWDSNIDDGVVCGVWGLTLCATRMTEGSHRASTAAEIATWKSMTARNYAKCVEEENARSHRQTITVEAMVPVAVVKK